MKKIILFIALLASCVIGVSQPPIVNRQPSRSNTLMDHDLFVDFTFRTPVFADTTAANAAGSLDSCGRMVFTYDVMAHWSRACDPKRWVRVGSTTSITGSQSIFIAGDGSPGAPYTPTLIVSQQSNNAVTVNPDGVFVPTQVQNGRIEGGIVIHRTGLTYTVTAARYAINGVVYTSPETDITLPNANADDRIDGFVVTTSGTAISLTGTPDPSNPQNPSYDPATQLPLTFVLVQAASTEPAFCRDSIYYPNNGNTWLAVPSNVTRINTTATSDPYSVTQHIQLNAAQNNDRLRMEKGSTISFSTYTVMVLRIKSSAAWASTSRLEFQAYNLLTPLGTAVIIGDGTPYGFNSSNLAQYQTVIIPIANLGSNLSTANTIALTVRTTGANTISAKIDDWELLGCDGTPPPTSGSFWNTTGNAEGRTLFGGTLDNQVIQFVANNINHTQLKTDGTTWMQGTNPGISFQLGTFAAADYFIQRIANTNTLNVAAGGIISHTIAGTSVNSMSVANGHLFNSSAGAFQMQLNPTGQLLVGTNSQTASNLVAFNSTTRAIRLTNQTDAQMNAIADDAGMLTYNTTNSIPYYNDGVNWIPLGANVTADNGLTMSTATNVQWGGTLLNTTTINTGGFTSVFTGANVGNILTLINTQAGAQGLQINTVGRGIEVTSSATGGAITAASTGSNTITAFSQTNGTYSVAATGIRSSTNTVVPLILLQIQTSGTAAAGIGTSIDFASELSNGSNAVSNSISSIWTDPTLATRTSQFIITGVNSSANNDIALFNGNGSIRFNDYGDGTFTGTPTASLLVDVDGNIIEGAVGITADNGLNMSSATNARLGGTLLQNTTIATTSSFTLTVSGSEPTTTNGIFNVTQTAATGYGVYATANSTSNAAILGQSSTSIGVNGSGNVGVLGSTTSGTGLWGTATSGIGLLISTVSGTNAAIFRSNPSSTNTVVEVASFERTTSGTAANNIGIAVGLKAEVDNLTTQTSTQFISKWTTAAAATRTSQFIITGVNSSVTADIFTLAGNGAMTLGAAYQGSGAGYLAVDNAGLVTWSSGSGGGGGDVLKVGTPANDQLGVWTGNGTIEGDVDLTFTGSSLTIGVAGSTTGQLLLTGLTSGTITIQGASAAGTYTLTLPTDDGGAGQYLKSDGSGNLSWDSPAGAGTVTSFTFTDANGFDGTVTTSTSTPTLSLAVTATGILKASGGVISAAVSGTDYLPINGGTSVATVGTITTGTWQGTTVGATFGGTGQTTVTSGQILYGSALNTWARLNPGTTGQVLTLSVAGFPVWSTPGSGTGTVTSVSGGTTGLTFTNPTTTPTMTGTLGFANGGTSATSRQDAINALAGAVTNGQVLRGNGTNIVMGQVNAATDITGTLQLANGGLGTTTITSGQIFIGAGVNTIIKGQILGTANQINSTFNGTNYIISHAFNPTEQVLTSGAVITWNLLNGGNALLTLTNTGATLASPSNVVPGYTYTLRIIQGSGGGRTIATWTNIHWTGGTLPTLQTAVGKMDVIRLYAVSSSYFIGTLIPDVQ